MFWISLLFIIISSYLVLSIITSKTKNDKPISFLYFLLISFSQIIISFEILSLFKSISRHNFFSSNIIFLILSIFLFLISKSKLYIPEFEEEIRRIKFALKKDKILGFLSICFVIFLVSQLITAMFFPVTFGDSLVYYLTRCTAWIQNGSINHFITPDTRELIMPVNMEFLYTWLLLFRQNETGCAVFSYISGIGAIYIIYHFLKELGFSVRRRLWSIFVFSSFALIAIEMYTPAADLFIGSLILGCIYLFLKSIKENSNTAIFFSSLCYALATGTKTTALIAIPSIFIVLVIIANLYKKETASKQILKFCLLFIVNFLIFSSYNYILNTIQYLNPITCNEQMQINLFRGGFKGWLSNLVKYCFAIFDVSGIQLTSFYNNLITNIQAAILSFIGVNTTSYTSTYFDNTFNFNSKMSIMDSALGIMGILAFLPSLIKSLILAITKQTSKRNLVLSALAISLVLNLLIFSRIMVFTKFNMRYILTFAIIASPIVAYSYIKNKKNIFKKLMSIFMFVYLVFIAHIKPVSLINTYIKHKNQTQITISNHHFLLAKSDETEIYDYLLNNKAVNVAIIVEQVNTPNYYIEKLRLTNIKMEKLLLESIAEADLTKYDYIITNKTPIMSTNVVSFKERINNQQKFINKCIYYDYMQQEIINYKGIPAAVSCEIPINYIESQGFYVVKDIKLNNYNILKNKNDIP